MTLNDSIKASFDNDTVVLTDTDSGNTVTLTKQSIWTMFHYFNGVDRHKVKVLKIIEEYKRRYPEAKDMFTDEKVGMYMANASAYYDEVIGYAALEDEIFEDVNEYKNANK